MAAVHRVMHSVSASIEYVCSTTTAANSGPTTSLCTAGNATRPIAATEGASATTAVRTTSVAPGLVISVLRREYTSPAPACSRLSTRRWRVETLSRSINYTRARFLVEARSCRTSNKQRHLDAHSDAPDPAQAAPAKRFLAALKTFVRSDRRLNESER